MLNYYYMYSSDTSAFIEITTQYGQLFNSYNILVPLLLLLLLLLHTSVLLRLLRSTASSSTAFTKALNIS